MPSWQTRFDNCLFDKLEDVLFARLIMPVLIRAARAFGVPSTGTRWSTRRFGSDTVIFAEWELNDEISSGIYDA